jgi:hypothetical protein
METRGPLPFSEFQTIMTEFADDNDNENLKAPYNY